MLIYVVRLSKTDIRLWQAPLLSGAHNPEGSKVKVSAVIASGYCNLRLGLVESSTQPIICGTFKTSLWLDARKYSVVKISALFCCPLQISPAVYLRLLSTSLSKRPGMCSVIQMLALGGAILNAALNLFTDRSSPLNSSPVASIQVN